MCGPLVGKIEIKAELRSALWLAKFKSVSIIWYRFKSG